MQTALQTKTLKEQFVVMTKETVTQARIYTLSYVYVIFKN